MILGRVIGSVVSTQKLTVLQGFKLLVVQPVDDQDRPQGGSLVALDTVQAGPGDRVLVLDEGNSARMILQDSTAPVRTVVAGIVDRVVREA